MGKLACRISNELGYLYIVGLCIIAVYYTPDSTRPMLCWSYYILAIRIVCEFVYFYNKTKMTP